MALIERPNPTRDFTKLPNELLRTGKLKFSDIGMLVVMLSKSPDFRLNHRYLRSLTPDGKDAIEAIVARLQKLGYVAISRERGDDGAFDGATWRVHAEPQPHPENPDVGNPDVVPPHPGKPDPEKPHVGLPDPENPPLPRIEKNKEQTTTTTDQEPVATDGGPKAPVVVVDLAAILLPDCLPPEAAESVRSIMAGVPPETRQDVLDELSGMVAARKVRSTPLNLLRALAAAATKGQFTPLHAYDWRASRRRAQAAKAKADEELAERRRQDTPEARAASQRAREVAMASLGRLKAAAGDNQIIAAK